MKIQEQMDGAADPHHVAPAATDASAAGNRSLRQQRFSERAPTHLQFWAGKSSCCIFRVPRSLVDFNPKACEPRIVSIGPYHHGREPTKMVEEHKPRYFSNLVARTGDFDGYFDKLSSMEKDIRACYSQPLKYEKSDLIEMMVLDGCFIIEVFRIVAGVIKRDPNDPLFNMIWVFYFLTRDFLQLENQIPFFVLQTLYNLSKSPEESQRSLIQLALEFFNCTIHRPSQELEKLAHDKHVVSSVRHLLHLLQLTYTYSLREVHADDTANNCLHLIQSAGKLHQAGIKFKLAKSDEKLLDIQFHKGVLLIPPLNMDDFMSCFFLNCLAFEQCYCHTKNHITTYIQFMGCLMRTAADSSFLSDCQILVNYCGSDAEVARFFNDLVKDIGFDFNRCYLAREFQGVNRYYKKRRRVWWAGIKREYFGTPWSLISALAAFTIIVLTFIQAFIALYAYFRPPKIN